MNYKLYWTDEALKNLEDVIDYLSNRWTGREIKKFKKKLSHQIDVILKFPLIFPQSNKQPRLRKAVLSKQTIIFYEIKQNVIYLVYLFDARQNPNKIK
jgi:plasmid stabilization system protein ParE